MKTNAFETKTWDDLVFENKNKEYGAYLVRKSYSQNITAGLGISVSLACLMLIAPQIISKLTGTPPIVNPIVDIIELPIVDFIQPPPVEPPPAQQLPPPAQNTQANLPLQVTTADVDTDVPTNDEFRNSTPSVDNSTGGVPDGSSVGAIETPPAVVEPAVFLIAEVMPQYEGGLKEMFKFVGRKVRYPASARRLGISGTVIVSFVIDKEGRVTDVNVLKGISEDCDKEAVRVVSLLNAWTPGMQNHRAVAVRMTLPIKFTLEDN
jgi:protein TonB